MNIRTARPVPIPRAAASLNTASRSGPGSRKNRFSHHGGRRRRWLAAWGPRSALSPGRGCGRQRLPLAAPPQRRREGPSLAVEERRAVGIATAARSGAIGQATRERQRLVVRDGRVDAQGEQRRPVREWQSARMARRWLTGNVKRYCCCPRRVRPRNAASENPPGAVVVVGSGLPRASVPSGAKVSPLAGSRGGGGGGLPRASVPSGAKVSPLAGSRGGGGGG